MTTVREFEQQQERELRGLSKTTDCGLIKPDAIPETPSADPTDAAQQGSLPSNE